MARAKTIPFAKGMRLPVEVVTQKCAIMARSGWGKTYAARKLAEGMIKAGAPVIVLDPVGTWWGMRLAADGQSAGLSVPIIGGLHGDLELPEPAPLAELLAKREISAVIDVSQMRKAERLRWCAEFAEELFLQKKRRHGAVHVFLEEAQQFVPQRVGPKQARMVGAFEDLCRLGRNFGIGYTLVSQRPQSVNKEVLNQAEVLIVGQVVGKHERDAIAGWIVEQGLDSKEMVEQLPSLPTGADAEGFLWSPSWLGKLERIRVLAIDTYDSSSTPTVGAAAPKRTAAAVVDVDELAAELGAVVEEARANDPERLKVRIRQLEVELRSKEREPPKREVVEIPAISDDEWTTIREGFAAIDRGIQSVRDGQLALENVLAGVQSRMPMEASDLVRVTREVEVTAGVPARRPIPVPAPSSIDDAQPRNPSDLPLGCAKVLTAVLQAGGTCSAKRAAFIAGYSLTSSTMRGIMAEFRRRGLVNGTLKGDLTATAAGVAAIPDVEPLPTGSALRSYWLGKLGNDASSRLLRALVDAYPADLSKAQLEAATGYSATSSTMRGGFAKLAKLGLATGSGDTRRAADELFDSPVR